MLTISVSVMYSVDVCVALCTYCVYLCYTNSDIVNNCLKHSVCLTVCVACRMCLRMHINTLHVLCILIQLYMSVYILMLV